MPDHLFTGLKVIDCASLIAGPAAATILSDFGADVIKIEPPGAGDPAAAPFRAQNRPHLATARNKRSLALDLRPDGGRAVLHRLVKRRRRLHHQLSRRRCATASASPTTT